MSRAALSVAAAAALCERANDRSSDPARIGRHHLQHAIADALAMLDGEHRRDPTMRP